MFQKPDREGGLVNEPLLARGLLTHRSVESYDRRADVLCAKSFSSFEGQSYALRLAF